MRILKIIEGALSVHQSTVTIGNTIEDSWEIVEGTVDTPVANNRAIILVAAGADSSSLTLSLTDATGWTELLSVQNGVGAATNLHVAAWWKPRTVITQEVVTVRFGNIATTRDLKAWAIVVSDTGDVDLAYDGQDTAINTITFPAIDIEQPGDLSLLVAVMEDETTDITTPTDYTLENIEAGTATWTLALYSRNVAQQDGLSVTTDITGAEWHALHITSNGIPLLASLGDLF